MKELLEIIEDYLLQEETNYALLIKGNWGCGKTYFWRKF